MSGNTVLLNEAEKLKKFFYNNFEQHIYDIFQRLTSATQFKSEIPTTTIAMSGRGLEALRSRRYPDINSWLCELPVDLGTIDKNPATCTHTSLNKWDGILVCRDCDARLNDTPEARDKYKDRIAEEEEKERNTPPDLEHESKSIGQLSQERGVSIEFLLMLTVKYGMFDWTAHDVIRRIVKPSTEARRCRFVELIEMQDHVGPATTFISYAQSGKWGDLVAAILCDGKADLKRYVWLDVFAVRQWPSETPDLDFASTIEHCSSFMVVCSHQQAVEDMDNADFVTGKTEKLPKEVRVQICFFRVWCLVEAHKACTMPEMPFILRAGSYKISENGDISFQNSSKMITNLHHLVNVEKAEATVESDRERILGGIRQDTGGGIGRLNRAIRGAVAVGADGGGGGDVVRCAACGDEEALREVMSSPNDHLINVARGGFIRLLRGIVDNNESSPVNVNAAKSTGWTALMAASHGGHDGCVGLLLSMEVLSMENPEMPLKEF